VIKKALATLDRR